MVAARVPCSRRDPAAGSAGLRGRAPTAPSASRVGAAAVGGRGGVRLLVILSGKGVLDLPAFPGRSLAHALATLTHSTPVTARDADTRDAPPTLARRGATRGDRESPAWRERPSLASFWPGFIKDTCTTRSLKQTKHDSRHGFLQLVRSRTSIPDRRRTNLSLPVLRLTNTCAPTGGRISMHLTSFGDTVHCVRVCARRARTGENWSRRVGTAPGKGRVGLGRTLCRTHPTRRSPTPQADETAAELRTRRARRVLRFAMPDCFWSFSSGASMSAPFECVSARVRPRTLRPVGWVS